MIGTLLTFSQPRLRGRRRRIVLLRVVEVQGGAGRSSPLLLVSAVNAAGDFAHHALTQVLLLHDLRALDPGRGVVHPGTRHGLRLYSICVRIFSRLVRWRELGRASGLGAGSFQYFVEKGPVHLHRSLVQAGGLVRCLDESLS